MIEQGAEKFLPKCWRSVENHPDMISLIPAVAQTDNCPFRVRREVPWADRSRIIFECADPRAIPIEKVIGVTRLTVSADPATFCEPYDLYRRSTGEESQLIIEGKVVPIYKELPKGSGC